MPTKSNGEISPPLKCSTCPISCGCAWDCLRGDDLSEITILRNALMEIALDHKTYTGHGTYDEGPHVGEYCQQLARDALRRADGE